MKQLVLAFLLSITICGAQSLQPKVLYNFDQAATRSSAADKVVGSALYKGQNVPVYMSARGAMYIKVVSKAGKPYKKYLPKMKD